jgi:hypothetical protein
MSSTRGMNGSAHGRDSLAAKRERYESESAATPVDDTPAGHSRDQNPKPAPRARPPASRSKE